MHFLVHVYVIIQSILFQYQFYISSAFKMFKYIYDAWKWIYKISCILNIHCIILKGGLHVSKTTVLKYVVWDIPELIIIIPKISYQLPFAKQWNTILDGPSKWNVTNRKFIIFLVYLVDESLNLWFLFYLFTGN